MTITKEELAKMIEQAGERDPAVMAELTYEFLQAVNHKRPVDMISPNAGVVAWMLMRDRGRAEPVLTTISDATPDVPGVPKKTLIDFTLGLMLGIYLVSKGEGRWPTTPTKPE